MSERTDYVAVGEIITSAPRVNAALDIVREMSERGPFYSEARMGGWGCDLCTFGFDDWGSQNQKLFHDPANHEPSCLWRRARELYPR